MNLKRTFSICLLITASLLSKNTIAQDAAALYKPCSVCHTIGKGKLIGPDLLGISQKRTEDWLIKFIQSSKQMIGSGDAEATAIAKEFNNSPMPDNNLSADQIKSILAFIDGGNTSGGNSPKDAEQSALQKQLDSLIKANTAESILIGKEYFNGRRPFANGGSPCNSCHNVTANNTGHGGLLAKDLTNAFGRLGGFAGIKGIMAMPPYPAMQTAYKQHPVTEEESAFIQIFLKNADKLYPTGPIVNTLILIYSGIGMGIIIAGIILLFWFKRKRRSVNYAIMKRQERYAK